MKKQLRRYDNKRKKEKCDNLDDDGKGQLRKNEKNREEELSFTNFRGKECVVWLIHVYLQHQLSD